MIISSPQEAVNHANIELRDGHRMLAHFVTELAGHQLDRLYTYSLEGRKNRNIYVFENGFVKVGNTLEKNLELKSTFEDDAILSELVSRMEKLNIEEKEVLILRYINGFEIKEICEIIDKNYDATKVFINRSINKLRKLINEKSN